MPRLVLLLAAVAAFATPSRLLRNQDLRHEWLSGVARFSGGLTCTAFLIQPVASDDAPVYALTNGHCLGLSGNQVVAPAPLQRGSALTFHYFFDTPSRRISVPLRAAPYATMKGLDVAVVELETTWAALAAAGVRPVTLSRTAPAAGDTVFTVGAPVSGVPDAERWLRKSECAIAAQAQLAEGVWKFHDALRLPCGGVFAGASGSPVFDARTREVIAIINTSTQGAGASSGDFPCFTNYPCELTQAKGELVPEAAYGLPLTGIANCFDASGRFRFTLPACPLDPGLEPLLRGAPVANVRPGAAWNVSVSGAGFTEYRYKTGPEHETDCRRESGYSAPVDIATPLREPIPSADGRYILCVLGNGQQARHATFAHTAVDTVPPALSPRWLVRGDGRGFSVQMIFIVPDLSDYRYKFGPEPATDCDNPDGYQIYRRVPINVPAATAPLIRFCILGGDRNDNFTRPAQILLGESQPLPSGVVNGAGFAQGPLAPGAWASIFLASETADKLGPLTLRDAAGTEHTLQRSNWGSQINVLIPRTAALGRAELRIPSPVPASVSVDLQPAAPGIYLGANGLAVGTTGFVPANGLALVDGTPITVLLAGQRVTGTVSGFVVRYNLPPNFAYRGYVPIQLEHSGIRSNIAYLLLPDEGI